jgi:hypothetical protein
LGFPWIPQVRLLHIHAFAPPYLSAGLVVGVSTPDRARTNRSRSFRNRRSTGFAAV